MSDPAKQAARAQALQKLRALPEAYVQERSARLRELLRPHVLQAQRICLFAPLPHEVNLLPLLHEAPGRSYFLPRCLPGHRLSFHRVQNPADDLEPGAMGIPAPKASLPCLPPDQVELMLVPGLAFTRSGKRLGYGGGYYDRYLPLLSPRALVLAPALPEQIVPDLPTDAHDVPIRVLTQDPFGMTNDE